MVDFSGSPQLAKSGSVPNCWPTARLLALTGLIVLVIVAVGLRLVPIIVEPSLNWGDEIFQTLEPAHRLVYGYGLVTWEFQLGMRSWLLPGFVAAIMEAARLIGHGPDIYLPAIAVVFALLASAPVICCFLWARRWYGFPAAFAGAALVAIAPELVYFGARALSETVAAHLLVIGFFLLQKGERRSSRRHLFAAGALLGVACLLRIHMGPAVLALALWASPASWRSRLPALIAGGLVAGTFGAALDWVSLGYPLASLWRNILFNIINGVSADFGTEPWNYYLLGELGLWGTGGLFMLIAAVLGARRLPALMAAALVIVAVHSGFAHKEYRFIYPAVVLITVLAGLGLAQLTQWAVEWLARQGSGSRLTATLCAALLFTYSGSLMFKAWASETMVELRSRAHDGLLAAAYVRHMPSLCGLGLYGAEGRDWVIYGGYTYLHRPVRMYWPADERELTSTAPGFDTLIYTAVPPAELGFTPIACFSKTCVARRSGACAAQSMTTMPFPEPLRSLRPHDDFEAVPALASRTAVEHR
jgi:GPI mannosyltransferase 3